MLRDFRFGGACRWAEPTADKPQVPALECDFPQVGFRRYETIPSLCFVVGLARLLLKATGI